MSEPIRRWICVKCGRSTMSQRKPGENGVSYPKCPKSLSGKHSWSKE